MADSSPGGTQSFLMIRMNLLTCHEAMILFGGFMCPKIDYDFQVTELNWVFITQTTGVVDIHLRRLVNWQSWTWKMTEQIDCRAMHLKCWGTQYLTCNHKVKYVTPSMTCRAEPQKQKVFDDLSRKDEKQSSSVRPPSYVKGTILGNTSGRRDAARMGFPEGADIT